MRSGRSSVSAIVAAAVLALVLAACGPAGGEDPAAGEDTGAGASTPATAPTTTDPGGSDVTPEGGAPPEALDFTATTVAGASFDAAELAGEPVLLWFWAPWCPRCRAQAPAMRELSEEVTIVGVGGLAPAGDMQEFIDRTETGGMTHLSDPDGVVWSKFGVAAQETLVLIDADGEVVLNGIVSTDRVREHL